MEEAAVNLNGLVININGKNERHVVPRGDITKELITTMVEKSNPLYWVKSLHIGHAGSKIITDYSLLVNADPTKDVFVVTEKKPFLVTEDDNGLMKDLLLVNSDLSNYLSKSVCRNTDLFSKVGIPISAMKALLYVPSFKKFQTQLDIYNHFATRMIQYADNEYKNADITDSIRFQHLGMIFTPDTKIVTKERDDILGCVIKETQYNTTSYGTSYFSVTVGYTQYDGDGLYPAQGRYNIEEYEGYRKLTDLIMHVMSKEEEEKLSKRGTRFIELSKKATHLHYNGTMHYVGYWNYDRTFVDGRVMVDISAFNEQNQNYRTFRNGNSSSNYNYRDTCPWMCWPTLPAFSFTTMQWGEVNISKLSEIDFNENAFDRIVIDQEKKDIIKAIIQNPFVYKDIVEGKGMGSIFLLHGPPGVGKTSSAEAVSEVLKKPLYKFTSGQLGIIPTELHKNLSKHLSLAQRWNAIALIDEVDIYLEKRADNDITRNAMVGIFLNLLEYYQGVLFLTTNRVQCFDRAFQSRISLSLHYKDFTPDLRCQVWKKQLSYAKLDHLFDDQLGTFDLNGRQIGTYIRIAMSLAASEGEGTQVNYAHLIRVIRMNADFLN